jgi:outer membrane protein assembly factor BamB
MTFKMTLRSLFVFVVLATAAAAENWPQFRGAHSGRVASEQSLPTEIGPETYVRWKRALAPGHSSPIVVDQRIYLTSVRDGKQLVTTALDRATGETVWEREAAHDKLEEIHTIGSHAQSTPCSDGERVVSFFGSAGLFCYDVEGKPLWEQRMGPFNNTFGAGSSPIIVDDYVILSQDHDTDSFLMAVDKRTGKTVWRTDRSEFPRNYCTPVVWEVNGRKQLVVAATLRVVGYDLATGRELWTVRGIARSICASPVVGDDNMLYVSGWAAGGDAGELIRLDPFDDVTAASDANKDQLLTEDELPKGPVKQRFVQIDRDKSGTITRAEYDYFRMLFDKSKNNVLAIRPGGEGDVSATHVAWEHTKLVPFCASPVFYRGVLFTVKDGGIVTSLDAATGKPEKQGRLPAADAYYASPVAADGKVYFVNDEGKLTVTSAAAKWEVLATADFGEPVYATPAIADGRIYFRTAGHLYCFGEK